MKTMPWVMVWDRPKVMIEGMASWVWFMGTNVYLSLDVLRGARIIAVRLESPGYRDSCRH